jgi:hypothetical protein
MFAEVGVLAKQSVQVLPDFSGSYTLRILWKPFREVKGVIHTLDQDALAINAESPQLSFPDEDEKSNIVTVHSSMVLKHACR